MNQKRVRKAILTIVFILALVVFEYFTNRGNADMTADMGSATLPTVSFATGGFEVNLLAGHKGEMDISAMRDTITPIDDNGTVKVNVQSYDQSVDSLTYEVYSLDGNEKILEETEKKVNESVTIEVGDALAEGEEGILKIILDIGDEQEVYYYTRIFYDSQLYLNECLDYAKTLHTNMLQKTNTTDIKSVMEENAEGDNTTLQHVTIHSDLEHSTWGSLKPEIIGDVKYEIKETKEAYTSILMSYRVKCAGDNNAEEVYNVKEFFRIQYANDQFYLLTYDRTMNEIFDGTNVVLTSKGINLGLSSSDIQYKANQDGTIVAFVQENELWSYNMEEDEFAMVFSFADSEKDDIRNYFDDHSVRILSMEEDGNITFGVYGYMNRGSHEGESGVTIYYFNLSQNSVEEKAFIPSNQSKTMIEEQLGELAYYNSEANLLYVLVDGALYKINLEDNQKMVLLEGLNQGEYVSSNDGHLIAYEKNQEATEVEILNFEKDSTQSITAAEGETIYPLGFIYDDFLYGISKPEYAGINSSGEAITPMYKVEICDDSNEVVKTYQVEGAFVTDAVIKSNMITLKRVVYSDGYYTSIQEDYITNNEESANSVTLQTFSTDLKETQYRLVFEDGISNKKAKVLKPKQVLFERDTTMDFEHSSGEAFYTVYGLGELAGAYTQAGEAVQKAKEISGVVISPNQRYVWEDGNRVAWYRNFEMSKFVVNEGEDPLTASVRAILAYEGKEVDVVSETQSKTAFDVLNEHVDGEAVRFQECSSADMRYLIDKGTPVIAMTGGTGAVVLIGYDAKSVTYIDPTSGGTKTVDMTVMDEMTAASGNTFIGYVK